MICELHNTNLKSTEFSSSGKYNNTVEIKTVTNVLFRIYIHPYSNMRCVTVTGVGIYSSVPIATYEIRGDDYISGITKAVLDVLTKKVDNPILESAHEYIDNDPHGYIFIDYTQPEIYNNGGVIQQQRTAYNILTIRRDPDLGELLSITDDNDGLEYKQLDSILSEIYHNDFKPISM